MLKTDMVPSRQNGPKESSGASSIPIRFLDRYKNGSQNGCVEWGYKKLIVGNLLCFEHSCSGMSVYMTVL